ncbi:hypothetical protein CsSME_00046438 [Camellia sinensis var. sinensis]
MLSWSVWMLFVVVLSYVMLFALLVWLGVFPCIIFDSSTVRSPWTRSCEKQRAAEASRSKAHKVSVKMEGRILFKQTKVLNNAVGRNASKGNEYPQRLAHMRINYRSNVAGIIKLVSSVKLREAHMNQLKRTPFWIMIEAIHVNKLNHNEFRKCNDLISKIIKTYDPRDNAFHIGGASVKFTSSDVRLIFGLQCGKRRLDLTPGQ